MDSQCAQPPTIRLAETIGPMMKLHAQIQGNAFRPLGLHDQSVLFENDILPAQNVRLGQLRREIDRDTKTNDAADLVDRLRRHESAKAVGRLALVFGVRIGDLNAFGKIGSQRPETTIGVARLDRDFPMVAIWLKHYDLA